MCVRARSTAVSMLARPTAAARRFALRGLQLHQDGGKPLRQVVVNVAREAVALLEDRLAPLFEPVLLRQPALMQRQRRLARDRLDQRHAPLTLARRDARVGRERDPAEIAAAQQERRHGERMHAGAAVEVATVSGSRGSSVLYSMVCVQPGL